MNGKDSHRRQFVSFGFYKVAPEWRRLPFGEREEHHREFAEVITRWQLPDTMKTLTYSTVGLRADTDFMIWHICYSLDCLQEMAADLLRTSLGGYISMSHSLLGMTRHSEYAIGAGTTVDRTLKGAMHPGGHRYLVVYPLIRTRSWYVLPFEERRRMVNELIKLSSEFPHTRLNVAYSFGIDEQDFIISVETDSPDEYQERMMQAKEIDISPFTERDQPKFTCVRVSIEDMLKRAG